MTLLNGFRCPTCKDRLIRQQADHAVLLVARLVVYKSDGRVEGQCPRCKTAVGFTPEMTDALRTAIFLRPTKRT